MLNTTFGLFNAVIGSWEMKFAKEECILKLDKCGALFQIHSLAAQDPWRRISTRKSALVELASGSASLSSLSYKILQVAKMCQAQTVDHHIAVD